MTAPATQTHSLLERLGVPAEALRGGPLAVRSPIDGSTLAQLPVHTADDVSRLVGEAQSAFLAWRSVPAPRRGELIRLLGEELRAEKEALGTLVSLEAGKILTEGLGEVQEMIDICDFAVGLSRQLHGLTIASERPGHRMMESWHPLGVVGVISAFNFPAAVWSWNFALAIVCGDAVVWKPSEKTPLTALRPSGASPKRCSARASSAWQASAVSGVFSDGFHTQALPQTRASAAFHDHTATGKLNALMTPTTPSGCHCSIIRWPGRSEAIVRP